MFKGTTVVCVRRQGRTALGADGQVTLGSQIVKGNARKVRRLHKGTVLAGFAGGTADAMTLLESFEKRLEEQSGHLLRAAAFLVKEWRTDKVLRRLEAMLLVADREQTLLLSGSGDILEPEGPVAAIGSGAGYALAAARALCEASEWEADRVARRSLELASEICIYTNAAVTVEVLA